jgi:hypothetical protein
MRVEQGHLAGINVKSRCREAPIRAGDREGQTHVSQTDHPNPRRLVFKPCE